MPISIKIICIFFAIFLQNMYKFLHIRTTKHNYMVQEKLRTLRKQKRLSQEKMAKILSTDTSNYSRKERGEVKIHDEEWEKLANALEVPIEEIKEKKELGIHNENFTFHDYSGNNVNYYNVPDTDMMMKNTQDYIDVLKEQIDILKQENATLKEKLKLS